MGLNGWFMRKIEYALPSQFYRDPSECVEVVNNIRKAAKRKADRARKNKSMRIQALVKQAMKNGGGNHGR